MATTHVRKDDMVVVIAGADKGRRGRVLELDAKRDRVIVEGVNTRRKHVRRSPTKPQGGIEDRDSPIHISNVMKAEKYDARMNRDGETVDGGAAQDKGDE